MSRVAGTELLEREGEIAWLTDHIDAAHEGRASLLVIEGPPGIGKSALLSAAVRLGVERRLTTLTSRGTALEQDYAFGVAVQLVESALVGADPERRDEAFAGAAALARPLFEPGEAAHQPAGDPGFRVLHGLYWLFVNLSERAPLLVAIDDVQWADAASLRFLAFLVKRLEGLPVVLALARRSGEAHADGVALDSLLTDPITETLRPSPLSPRAVEALVRERLAGEPDGAFVRACHETTGGNPFFALELLAELASEGVVPSAAQVKKLEEVSPDAIRRSVLVRLVRLGEDAQALARAAAVLGDAAALRHAAALAELDKAEARRAADALSAASILAPGDGLTFVHPVLRAAVHSDIPSRECSGAHARAARVLSDEGAPAERVAAQLLRSDAAADPAAADLLAGVGRDAMARGAPDAAEAYLRRALAEGPPDAQRAELLHDLGIAEGALGEPEAAIGHLRSALELAAGTGRVPIARALAVTLLMAARADEAVAVLSAEIERLGADQRELVVQLEADLVGIATQGGLARELIDAHLAKYRGQLAGETPGERMLLAIGAFDVALTGGAAEEAVKLARSALSDGALLREHTADSPIHASAVITLIYAGHHGEADPHIEEAIREAQARGSATGVAITLLMRSVQALRGGQIRDLETNASGLLELAQLSGWLPGLAFGLGFHALALVERAETSRARQLLEEYGMTGELPAVAAFDLILAARAQMALAEGAAEEALAEADLMAQRQEPRGIRSAVQIQTDWRTPAVLAHVALGHREQALNVAEELLALARLWDRPGPIGRALRVRALTEGEDAVILERLREAVEVTSQSDFRLEHARALVDLGAVLRRLRRPSEARAPLREAVEKAESLGARLVADLARVELEATGERRRKTQWLSGVESLTPSERRVAELAAQGLSNKAIAQSLFVTLKTVEVHLTQTYRKLGISSRTDLPAALA